MQMARIALLVWVVALASACGYDFDPETDRFRCTGDNECTNGFVCAGHSTSEENEPLTYCVRSHEAELAVWLATAPALASGCNTAWELDWVAYMVTSPLETPPPVLAPAQGDRDAFVAAGGACVGQVSSYGEMSIMCRMPEGDVEAKSAAAWGILYEKGTEPFVAQNQIAVAFSAAAIHAETRMAPAPDAATRTHHFDEHLANDQARCFAAAARMCPTTSILCTGCAQDEQCPRYFACDPATSACKPTP